LSTAMLLPEFPKLRDVEILPITIEGKSAFVLKDPSGIATQPLVIPPGILFILSQLNGENTLVDIQAAYMRKFQDLIFREKLEEVISLLDENLFLESDRFSETFSRLRKEFSESPARRPFLAGQSYPLEPKELKNLLDEILQAEPLRNLPEGRIKALIAPHIDLQRGRACYGQAYGSVFEQPAPELVILLGTCHAPLQQFFSLTAKDFETPLGRLKSRGDLIEQLRRSYGPERLADEWVHRSEHSLEFQTLFLSHLFTDRPPAIIPILCGSFQPFIDSGKSPQESEEIRDFIAALREILLESREVMIIAGADLAHQGPQFGDPHPVGSGQMEAIRRADQEMLDPCLRGDAEGFFRVIAGEKDARRICGLPPIYLLLNLIGKAAGSLLGYGQWRDPSGQAMVSFAGLGFYTSC
jgi:MEMO1 family protein